MALGYRISAKGADRAEILIYEDVGEGWFGGVSAKQFADDLKALGAVSTIDVRINSYGGDVFEGFAMYRQLVEHKARIVVHVDGVAASIASVIAMAGNEIEIAPLAFMRGRTLTNAAIILDEAQNTTSMQMKMFLTRLGENSRMIVTGDPSQIDLPNGQTSGLAEAVKLLDGVEGIAQVHFKAEDVIRHELVARIVAAYEGLPQKPANARS